MPASGMPDRVEQSAEGVLIHRHLRRRVRLRLTVKRKGPSGLSADRNATLQRLEYVLDDILSINSRMWTSSRSNSPTKVSSGDKESNRRTVT
jgi:hypothetical protein